MAVFFLFFSYIYMLLVNIVIMLICTLIIAALTLIERKLLSLVQRRVGPFFVGYRGRLQYIADALKLFIKGIFVPNELSKFWFVFLPSFMSAICYSFWVNSVWGPSLSIFDIEYNFVYLSILSVFFSFCIVFTGYFSKSKYAFLASIRCILLTLNLELLLGFFLIVCVFFCESFCFSVYVTFQEIYWFFLMFFYILGLLCVVFLMETNRSPFDLAEAESELVAGYSVEYGGFYFALYYLGEYFHLFFFSMVFAILVLGGWNLNCAFFFLWEFSF